MSTAAPIPSTVNDVRSVVIGTAGHIDHGKTALVKALTGIDADRLEEEKRRGITIDLGFAHAELAGSSGRKLRLGFVDVPGHERFVRNMLAGVGGIDVVLLVVAADEGIKPQTREHFDICRMLNISRGITVITKSDLVDPETLAVVRLELANFLNGSFLDTATAPMVAVSSRTGAGMDDLRGELARLAEQVPPRDSTALFRLPIDRVFTMKGFGTVVTGTLVAGAVRKEDEVEVMPGGRRVRVRGIQVHNAAAERAAAGQRTALNLAGVEVEDLQRGMMLTSPGLLRATRRVEVALTLLSWTRPLFDRTRVHFHAYTGQSVALTALLEGKQIAAGQTSFVQMRLAEPMLLLPGDRFIIRQFSPVLTIGGGVVLDAAPQGRRMREGQTAFLRVLQKSDPSSILAMRSARRQSHGLSITEAVAETGWPAEQVERVARVLVSQSTLVRTGDLLLHPPAIAAMCTVLLGTLKKFHDRNPLVAGMPREELRSSLDASSEAFAFALNALTKEKKVEATGEAVRLAGRGVAMRDDEAEAKQKIENAFASAGLKVPALKDVLASLPLDKARAQKLVTLLLREGSLVKLADDLVFHRDALVRLRTQLQSQKATAPKIDVARFKELAGVSRKYAIPLLEYLDREHVTRRMGDERVIL